MIDTAMKPSRLILVLAFLVLVLHAPLSRTSFVRDDYLQWTNLRGSQELYELGISTADPNRGFWQKITDAFHFFDAEKGTTAELQAYGILPWWSTEKAKMDFFRPLAALTHYMDYVWWGENLPIAYWHSTVYFVLFSMAGFWCYQRLSGNSRVAFLAALLLAFDMSAGSNFLWLAARNSYMAVGLGLVCLQFYVAWLREGRNRDYLAAVGFLALGLLAGEAMVAITGYLFSSALFLSKPGRLKKAIGGLVPLAVVVIIWRLAYNYGQFGAAHVGTYMDPGRDPVQFLSRLPGVMAQLLGGQVTGVDAVIPPYDLSQRIWIRVASGAIFVLALFFMRKTLRDRVVLTMLVGCVLATIPHASLIIAGPRSMTFGAIGFLYVLAYWVDTLLAKGSSLKARAVGYVVLLLHLVGPALFVALIAWGLVWGGIEKDKPIYENFVQIQATSEDRSLVIVNHGMPNLPIVWHCVWDYYDLPLPKKVNILTPGLSSFTLTRETERVFVIESESTFVVNQDAPIRITSPGPRPLFLGPVFATRMFMGHFTDPTMAYAPGQEIVNADMLVEIEEASNGLPKRIRVTFTGEESPDEKVWHRYDWLDLDYREIEPPRVGESVRFVGPGDSGDAS